MFKKLKKTILIITSIFVLGIIAHSITITIRTSGTPKKVPIYSVETQKKQVAISFDAAWGAEHTEKILDALDVYGIKTTFFLVGFWIDKYPEMVCEIDRRGHEIGSHSAKHLHMNSLSSVEIEKEMKCVEKKLDLLTGKKPSLFRPPFGEYNDNLITTCKNLDYYIIQWDVDTNVIKVQK